MNKIDKDIVSFYEQQELKEAFVDNLLKQTEKYQKSFWQRWYRIAAVFILVTLPLGILLNHKRIVSKAASEIVTNHLKYKNVAYNTNDYAVLKQNLSLLPFPIKPSTFPENQNYRLIGGQYCSLGGKPAAQMKLCNPETNAIHTLYAAPLDKTLKWVRFKSATVQGVSVIFWVEGYTLFGLTQ